MIAMSVRQPTRSGAFTILELLIVISIIIILAGLVLSVSSYVQDKGARSRAEAEIAAMSAALESYKADNGIYPASPEAAALFSRFDNNSDPKSQSNYMKPSVTLFSQLAGENADQKPISGAKPYMSFKPQMLGGTTSSTNTVTFLRDPWGNCYGYSTAQATNPTSNNGYNPTYDLWSTANDQSGTRAKWIKNW